MAERLLITKLKKTSPTQAELFGARHRFRDLILFDLSELAAVGIDPETLPLNEERPCRFYALFEHSEKLNRAGNPYRDVLALEAIGAPATAGSMDNSALLAEVRTLRLLLTRIASTMNVDLATMPEPEPDPDPEPPPAPAVFSGPDHAVAWACLSGAFGSAELAQVAYEGVKTAGKPKTAAEMRDLWVAHVEGATA